MIAVLLLGAMGCQNQEAREAEALFVENLQQQLNEHEAHLDAVAASQTGATVAASISACLQSESIDQYGLMLSIQVEPDGLKLVSLAGTTSLLSETTLQHCIHRVLRETQPDLLPGFADAVPPVFEGHDITLFHTAHTPTQIASSPMVHLQPFTETQNTPMTLATDHRHAADTPWAQLDLPAALLACNESHRVDTTSPMLLALRLQQAITEQGDGQCTVIAGVPQSPYTDCICEAYVAHMKTVSDVEVTLTITEQTPDGRTVSSAQQASSAGSQQVLWLLRQIEDEAVVFRSHALTSTGLP